MIDKQEQRPYSNDNYQDSKPNVPKTKCVLHGYIAGSLNAGHNRPIAWAKVMAGQPIYELSLPLDNIKMLTPRTPSFQRLKATFRTYFVPNSRVWENAEAFIAQNPTNENRPKSMPNLGGQVLPYVGNMNTSAEEEAETGCVPFTQTRWYRDTWASCYIGRLGTDTLNKTNATRNGAKFPKINALPLRGYVAIYNDFLRNKEYQETRTEYKGDTVTSAEMDNYYPFSMLGEQDLREGDISYYYGRAKKDNSYYTDYRTDIQGFEQAQPTSGSTAMLTEWTNWEALTAEARSQAENANLNDWEIIRKIRGSKLLTQGKAQLIGQKTIDLNYKAVTQTSYNSNAEVAEEFQAMGTQGAYCFTEARVPLCAGFYAEEEGFIHVIMTVSADTVYENGLDRQLIAVDWDEQYRPDMKGQKYDVLYSIEMGTNLNYDQMEAQDYGKVIGYKRKWSELFKLPNCINGDMTTDDWVVFQQNDVRDVLPSYTEFQASKDRGFIAKQGVQTQHSFTFFEKDAYGVNLLESNYLYDWQGKNIWMDYTDLEINDNQAYKNELYAYNTTDIAVLGQNQIFYMGYMEMKTELPVNPEIATNYTAWGEH